ncbi:MAG: hypothetical protein AAGJ31_11770, partial [Verrucomicrobiota bacterium]
MSNPSQPEGPTPSEPTIRLADPPAVTLATEENEPVAASEESVPASEHLESSEVGELLTATETQQKRRRRRDTLNAIIVTILIHVFLIVALWRVVIYTPVARPPEIIATASALEDSQDMDTEQIEKPQVQPTDPTKVSLPEVVSVEGVSNFSVVSSAETSFTAPSLDFAAMAQSSGAMNFSSAMSMEPMSLFGTKLDSENLGVIIDCSNSLAEHIRRVMKKIDSAFKGKVPVIFVRQVDLKTGGSETQIIAVEPAKVVSHWVAADGSKYHSPYHFLFDRQLTSKADDRAVKRLLQRFREYRKDTYFAWGGTSPLRNAVEYMSTLEIDNLYIFTDFEGAMREETIKSLPNLLNAKRNKLKGQSKIKVYLQPVDETTQSG